MRHGSLTVTLDPMFFVAQNARFGIAPNGGVGIRAYADWRNPDFIDLPQRFGGGVYARVDPGESGIRWDGRRIAFGFTSAAEVWGPAVDHPIILGNNAAGIPRMFLGTSRPLRIGWLHVHSRLFWGRVDESLVGTLGGMPNHGVTGAIGSLSITGVPGLELGAGRFFHIPRSQSSISRFPWLRTFEGILKNSLASSGNPNGENPDNQLASLFFRWAPPRMGAEFYGEYGREDHSADLRDLAKEPDHDAAFLLGAQRVWGDGRMGRATGLRVELLNTRLSHLQQRAAQSPWYVHTYVRDGHTQLGQALGSPAAYGGGAFAAVFDRHSPNLRTTIRWDRLMLGEYRGPDSLPVEQGADVLHALTFQWSKARRGWRHTLTIGVMKELNRHFLGDAYSATMGFGTQRNASPNTTPRQN